MDFNADDLITRSKEYSEDKFKDDLDELLDSYKKLPSLDIELIREEIDSWDLSIPKDTGIELDEISGAYTKFIEYNNRTNKLLDDSNSHNQSLKFIISTAKDKESVISAMLLPISQLQNKIDILYDFISNTNKSIEFATSQLARILREREAIGKINNEDYRRGSNFINKKNNIVVNTRNKIIE